MRSTCWSSARSGRCVRFTDTARDDLVAIAVHIALESGSRAVAELFVAKLEQHCEKVAGLPGTLGRARPELRHDIRSMPHGNYTIFFRYLSDKIEIVTILNAARDIDEASLPAL